MTDRPRLLDIPMQRPPETCIRRSGRDPGLEGLEDGFAHFVSHAVDLARAEFGVHFLVQGSSDLGDAGPVHLREGEEVPEPGEPAELCGFLFGEGRG